MIEAADIRKAREDVCAAPADRWGCIRIRRQDILDMLNLIAAQDEALDAAQAAPRPRFSDRVQARGAPAKPTKIRA